MTDVVLIAIIGGLVALLTPIATVYANRIPAKKTNVKIDEILSRLDNTDSMIQKTNDSFQSYKIEQAIQDFSQKNWEIMDDQKCNSYGFQNWLLLKRQLEILVPEDDWSEQLKSETKYALSIIRKENQA